MKRRAKACAQCGRDCEEWALLCRECEGAIRINAPPPPPPPSIASRLRVGDRVRLRPHLALDISWHGAEGVVWGIADVNASLPGAIGITVTTHYGKCPVTVLQRHADAIIELIERAPDRAMLEEALADLERSAR